jgi:predicted O-methyltransferase YrrM
VTDTDKRAFAPPAAVGGRLFQSLVGAMDLMAVYLGDRLGYYRALASGGPLTALTLAAATGTDPRYAREWLEQQAISELLAVDDTAAAHDERRYSLPPGYEAVLADDTSPAFAVPMGASLHLMASSLPELMDAYRTGSGLSWAGLGREALETQAAFNRPLYAYEFAGLLATVPALAELLGKPGTTVAEIGCGAADSLIALATAYHDLHCDGFDLDPATVAMARENVESSPHAGRISIQQRDAADPDLAGDYDVVMALECIHDLSDPVSALKSMRRLTRPGGFVLVMDERTADEFGAFGDMHERLLYGSSLFVCLPDGMSRRPSAATGALMRPETLDRYAVEAGYSNVQILPVEHGMFRFYRLI